MDHLQLWSTLCDFLVMVAVGVNLVSGTEGAAGPTAIVWCRTNYNSMHRCMTELHSMVLGTANVWNRLSGAACLRAQGQLRGQDVDGTSHIQAEPVRSVVGPALPHGADRYGPHFQHGANCQLHAIYRLIYCGETARHFRPWCVQCCYSVVSQYLVRLWPGESRPGKWCSSCIPCH